MTAAAPSIPLSVGAIDAEWLGSTLRAAGHDVDVIAVDHVAVVGGNATKVRVRATYADDAEGIAETLCIKVGMELQDPSKNLTGSTYDIEGRFYRDVRPMLGEIAVPRCLAVVTEPATSRCALIMEDLIAGGSHFGDPRRDQLGVDQVRTLLAGLARLHGAWWQRPPGVDGSPTILADLDLGIESTNRLGRYYSRFDAEYVAERVSLAGDALPAPLRDADLLVDRFWSMAHRANSGSFALIHADPHLANIFLDANGGVGIADWQTMRWGRWAHDVAYLITSSLPVDVRRRAEGKLLRGYLRALQEVAGDSPSADDAQAAYAESMIYGLFGWLTAPPYFGYPLDFTNAYVARFAAAVLDHGTIELLGGS